MKNAAGPPSTVSLSITSLACSCLSGTHDEQILGSSRELLTKDDVNLSKRERIWEGHAMSEKNAMAAVVGTHGHASVSGRRVLRSEPSWMCVGDSGLLSFLLCSSHQAAHHPANGLRASEGKTVEVPYKGDVENTILDILGGLRSTCTYVGAAKLKELSRRATFIRVTQQHNTRAGCSAWWDSATADTDIQSLSRSCTQRAWGLPWCLCGAQKQGACGALGQHLELIASSFQPTLKAVVLIECWSLRVQEHGCVESLELGKPPQPAFVAKKKIMQWVGSMDLRNPAHAPAEVLLGNRPFLPTCLELL
ncbi:hypothetical protein U0070_027352, partial [Myodes glareolus]